MKAVWTLLSTRKVVKHEDGYFILQLLSAGEQDEVINGGPYFMNRRPIVVKKWSTHFDFYTKALKAYPIWEQLHNLPIEYWSGNSLSRVASVMGFRRYVDDCTTRQKRMKFARILVDVDVTVPLVEKVDVLFGDRKFQQPVEFEFRLKLC